MSANSEVNSKQQDNGLYHLVEAATALTQLVRVGSGQKVDQSNSKSHQISDDEESKSKQVTISSNTSSTDVKSNTTEGTTPPSLPLKPTTNENTKEIFPRRLFKILSDPSISDIITWLPHGRAFVILKTDELAESVLPRYFPESCAAPQSSNNENKPQTCKYPSFTRKLNRWGFRQVTRGPDSGAFHHKFFQREDPEMCLKMVCQRSKRRKGEKGISLKNSLLKPATSNFLGPYSAALRQPIEPSGNHTATKNPNVAVTDCDSDSSMKAVNTGSRRDEDQATIVSSRSCNTPPPKNQPHNMGSSISLMSPTGAPSNTSPESQMVRTISTTSSLAPVSGLNAANLSFPVFTSQGAQLDPRILLQHNFTATAFGAAAAAAGNLNAANANTTNLPSPAMPNIITLLDTSKTLHQQQSTQVQQAPAPSTSNGFNSLITQHFSHPIVPVTSIAPMITPTAPTPTPSSMISVSTNNTSVSSNSSSSSSNKSSCSSSSANSTTNQTQQHTQQQPMRQQQLTEAELRVANAKDMLYSAFLQALG